MFVIIFTDQDPRGFEITHLAPEKSVEKEEEGWYFNAVCYSLQ